MSVKKMDAAHNSSSEGDPKPVLIASKECEPTNFKNNSHSVRILEDLQSLRKYVKGDFSFIKNEYY